MDLDLELYTSTKNSFRCINYTFLWLSYVWAIYYIDDDDDG